MLEITETGDIVRIRIFETANAVRPGNA